MKSVEDNSELFGEHQGTVRGEKSISKLFSQHRFVIINWYVLQRKSWFRWHCPLGYQAIKLNEVNQPGSKSFTTKGKSDKYEFPVDDSKQTP